MVCTFAKPKKNIVPMQTSFLCGSKSQSTVTEKPTVQKDGWIVEERVMMSLKANLANLRPHNLKYLLFLVIISAFVFLQSRSGH